MNGVDDSVGERIRISWVVAERLELHQYLVQHHLVHDLDARDDTQRAGKSLGDRTRGLVGAKEFGLMKKTAYLINTSRGPIVDEKALLAALGGKQIAGAGLDVFDVEPLPVDHPLRKLDNVVLTPHLGYVSQQNYERYYPDIVENIRGWLDGKPVRVIAPR